MSDDEPTPILECAPVSERASELMSSALPGARFPAPVSEGQTTSTCESRATTGTTPDLQAVLVDMDGTLLDSERVWDVALEDLAAWLGGSLSERARLEMVGSSIERSIEIVHKDLGMAADPAASSAYLSAAATRLFETRLSWQPGAQELLLALQRERVPACLVTATQRRMTEIALDFMGRSFFEATVCGDEVEHNKPHPDPYLRAATLLGVRPQHCVVIEDSPTGAASGQAAGCFVVAVPSEAVIEPATRRTIVRSLTEVSVDRLRAVVAAG